MYQHQIANIHDDAGRLAEDDDRIAAENAIDRHQDSAGERQPPETDRHVTHAAPLGGNPLNDEARREQRLCDEAERGEQVPMPRARIDGSHSRKSILSEAELP